MIDKEEAIRRIHIITGSTPDDALFVPDRENPVLLTMRGEMAREKWYDGMFFYGMEYGYLWALIEAFNLTADDL